MRRVDYTHRALKDIQKLSAKMKERVRIAVEELAVNPLAGKKLRGDFEEGGIRSFRVWPLRILYSFDSKRLVIYTVDHRKDAYR